MDPTESLRAPHLQWMDRRRVKGVCGHVVWGRLPSYDARALRWVVDPELRFERRRVWSLAAAARISETMTAVRRVAVPHVTRAKASGKKQPLFVRQIDIGAAVDVVNVGERADAAILLRIHVDDRALLVPHVRPLTLQAFQRAPGKERTVRCQIVTRELVPHIVLGKIQIGRTVPRRRVVTGKWTAAPQLWSPRGCNVSTGETGSNAHRPVGHIDDPI